MKPTQRTAISLIILMTVIPSCAGNVITPSLITVVSATPTLDLFAQSGIAQATLNAANTQIASVKAESIQIGARLTATAQAPTVWAQQTDRALQVAQTQQAMAIQKSNATGTAVAAQTGTAIALMGVTATVEMNQTATTIANANATGTAIPHQTTQARLDKREELALQSESNTHLFWTWLPLIAFTALIIFIGFVAWRFQRVLELRLRVIPRNGNDAPLFALEPSQKITIIDPDRNFGAALVAGPAGVKVDGLAADPHWQDRVTARDQALDITRALPEGKKTTAPQVIASSDSLVESSSPVVEAEIVEGEVVVLSPDDPRVRFIVCLLYTSPSPRDS